MVSGPLRVRNGHQPTARYARRSWLPQRAGNRGVVGLGGPAEIPRPQSLVRQFGADLAGVVRVDPGVVLAAALVVGKGRAHSLVKFLKQRLLLSGVLGAQVVESEFGAELEAGSAVMPHALVVQQRHCHIALVQGEGASERGGVLEGLRGTLAKGGKHRMRRVPEQTDTALHPGFERITIVKAPLR